MCLCRATAPLSCDQNGKSLYWSRVQFTTLYTKPKEAGAECGLGEWTSASKPTCRPQCCSATPLLRLFQHVRWNIRGTAHPYFCFTGASQPLHLCKLMFNNPHRCLKCYIKGFSGPLLQGESHPKWFSEASSTPKTQVDLATSLRTV